MFDECSPHTVPLKQGMDRHILDMSDHTAGVNKFRFNKDRSGSSNFAVDFGDVSANPRFQAIAIDVNCLLVGQFNWLQCAQRIEEPAIQVNRIHQPNCHYFGFNGHGHRHPFRDVCFLSKQSIGINQKLAQRNC